MEKTIWKLTLAYDGTEFHGWQVQRDDVDTPTIQGTLSAAIHAVTGERVLPHGSGRTDAGVHASGQVASFALAAPIPPLNFQRALNRVLPAAIRIVAAEPAAADFHARHSAIGKVYRYRIFDRPVCSPFLARYLTCSRWPLDLEAMQAAAQAVLGEHDFTSFAALDPDRAARMQQRHEFQEQDWNRGVLRAPAGFNGDEEDLATPSNIRRIEESCWSRAGLPLSATDPFTVDRSACDDGVGQIFTYTVRGNGFLHHMVRNLVGTFVEIGRGRLAPADMEKILNARDRSVAGPTAPAEGLCLVEVQY